MLKWLTKKEYSPLDVFWIAYASTVLAQGQYVVFILVLLVGVFTTMFLEFFMKTKSE